MATNIPPHKLKPKSSPPASPLIEKPDITLAELMQIVPGPDFSDGRHHQRRAGNRSRIQDRPRPAATCAPRHSLSRTWERGDRQAIIITELPYQVNKAKLIERIADLVRDKLIDGNRFGRLARRVRTRTACGSSSKLKRGEVPEILLNNLFAADHDGKPCSASTWWPWSTVSRGLLSLKEMLDAFLRHRRENRPRGAPCSNCAKARGNAATSWRGLAIRPLANIDDIIAAIKGVAPSPGGSERSP